MAVFSTDQNRQFFYVGSYKADATELTTKGDATVLIDKDNNFHVNQLGQAGLLKTDVIDPANVLSVQASAPADMQKKLKQYNITLSAECNGGVPIAGEDYVLRVNFRQLYGMSDEDIYQKYGVVAATAAMAKTTDLFWLTLAESLVKNFKRTYSPLLEVGLVGATATTVITSISHVGGTWKVNGTAVTPASAYTGIAIIEKSQEDEWVRGVAKLEPVYFEVIPTTVYDSASDVIWGDVTEVDSKKTIGNGYDTADLEWFCMGERGDQYREKMWPNNIVTKYFVDETKEYYFLDITYAYKGDAEDIQNSKKTLTLVSPDKTALDSVIAQLESVKITVNKSGNFA